MQKNKFVKRILGVSLAAVLGVTALGCGGEVKQKYDDTKVQLFVGNYNAGYGYAYIEEINERFEEMYKDHDFGNGKVGVEVIIDNSPGFDASQIKNSKNAVYFTSGWLNYYNLIAQNALLDITSAVRADLGDYGEAGKSIESKLQAGRSDLIDQYKTAADKYYAIPLDGAGAYCTIYDVDLFENQSLYYKKGGCPSEYARKTEPLEGSFTSYQYTNGKLDEKSAGPDGKYGTPDDGLPATYEEFYNLCDYMIEKKSITPFTWSGAVASSYSRDFAYQSYADVEGAEGINLRKTLSGTAKTLGTVDANGNFTLDESPTDIYLNKDANGKFQSNGYEISRQAGMYYAIKFWKEIYTRHNKDYYTTQSRDGSESQTQAQSTYLYSTYGAKPVAFLSDGTWWQNEAADSFNALVQSYGESASKTNRRFGLLALPKPTIDYVGEKATLLSGGGMVFVNGNVSGVTKDLALEYIKFSCTDVSIKKFASIVGTVRPFKVDMTEEELSSLSNFTQELYYYMNNGSFVSSITGSDLELNHYDFFTFRSILEGETYQSPYAAFDAGKLNTDADVAVYFNSVCNRTSKYWNSYIIGK